MEEKLRTAFELLFEETTASTTELVKSTTELVKSTTERLRNEKHNNGAVEIFSAAWRPPMSSNMERVAAMPDASLYVNRDGRRADDCVDSMVEEI